jgi:hypothetical protein
VHSTVALLTLLLIVALGLVSPAGCAGCRFDTHGGQALHLVFDHAHPDAPAQDDDLSVRPAAQPELHTSSPMPSVGQVALAGQIRPGQPLSPVIYDPDAQLTPIAQSPPRGPLLVPLDPPPRMG